MTAYTLARITVTYRYSSPSIGLAAHMPRTDADSQLTWILPPARLGAGLRSWLRTI